MRQRCENPNAPKYSIYGGRGITVCERWATFANFLADMGERPEGTSLDRIDPDGDYRPGNCRWATKEEQRRNRRDSKITWDDVNWIRSNAHLPRVQVAKRFGVYPSVISRIVNGKTWVA